MDRYAWKAAKYGRHRDHHDYSGGDNDGCLSNLLAIIVIIVFILQFFL